MYPDVYGTQSKWAQKNHPDRRGGTACGTHRHIIRFYERRALLPAAPRTTDQFRLYTADDVTRLNFIKQMQGLSFSLQQIKQLLDLRDRGRYACEDVRNLLKNKLIEVRSKIRQAASEAVHQYQIAAGELQQACCLHAVSAVCAAVLA